MLLLLLTSCSVPPPASGTTSVPPSVPTTTSPPTHSLSTTAPTSTATPIALPSFAQLSAPSANVVWALVAGSRLFRSSDRGDTWQERSAALDALGPDREVAFISDNEGWLATPGQPGTQ